MPRIRRCIYQDVSDDPDAARQVAFGVAGRQALEENGFQYLGILRINTNLRFNPDEAQRLLPGPDGILLSDSLKNGEFVLVFTCPNKQAFATVENYFGEAVISLRTLLEDGRVIETTTRPARKPKTANVIATPQRVTGLMATAIMANTIGPGEAWPRTHRPQAGYHQQLLATQDVAQLWQAHQGLVTRVNPDPAAEIRAHLSMGLLVCMYLRAFMLIEHRGRWNWVITNITFVAFFLAIISLIHTGWKITDQGLGSPLPIILAVLAAIPLLGAAAVAAQAAASKYLIRVLPGPALVSAAALASVVRRRYLL